MGAGESGVDVSGSSCLSLIASDHEYHLLLLLYCRHPRLSPLPHSDPGLHLQ